MGGIAGVVVLIIVLVVGLVQSWQAKNTSEKEEWIIKALIVVGGVLIFALPILILSSLD